MTDALYLPEGRGFVPTELTRGPWYPDVQHGGPVAALCARAVQRCAAAAPMQLARLTVELFRPAPMAPLAVHAEPIRDGRRLQVVEVTVTSGQTEVCRARGLRLRADPGTGVEPAVTNDIADPPLPRPESGWRFGDRGETVAGFYRAVEHRRFEKEPGRRRLAWLRLTVPVVAGETTTPSEQAAALADVGSGISVPVDFRQVLQINAEVSLHLLREPVGEWLALAARTTLGDQGIGLSDTELFDATGRVGASHQALLVDRR